MMKLNLFTVNFKIKNKLIVLPIIFFAAVILFTSQAVLRPKYISEAPEGRLIGEYYDSDIPHDVIFIGDCEVYENIDPVVLWSEYGISSYVRGSPQQLIWTSYYIMKETMKYEMPKVFVFNILSMKYGEPQNEAYNRISLDGMRNGIDKLESVLVSMTEEETAVSYLFPILRFHDRWKNLKSEDWLYAFKSTPRLSCEGYLMRTDVKGTDFFPKGQLLPNYDFSDVCWEYLDKMVKLCRDNAITLVLMKAPSIIPYWYKEWDDQIIAYAEKNGLLYINAIDELDNIGINYQTDTYDAGLHLNIYGAEKLSRYLGNILCENYGIDDHRGEYDYNMYWAAAIDFHQRMYSALSTQINEDKRFTGYPNLDIQ